MAYTTLAKVCAELGINSSTITSSSVPSTSDIDAWISEAKSEIDTYTGRVWESTSISTSSPEYYDYDGSGIVKLNNTPVISVEQLEADQNGVGSTSTDWQVLYEGRTSGSSFELYKDEGIILFHGTTVAYRPKTGTRSIRVAYTYGKSTTPLLVTRLATLMVADRYITSYANASAGQLGGTITVGPISVSDSSMFSVNQVKNIRAEKERLFGMLGTLKTVSPVYGW